METDATYRKGYKQGVLDATAPMKEGDPVYNDPSLGSLSFFEFTNYFLADRRKNLISKKVTKWVNVGRVEPCVCDPSSVRWGYGTLYDDKVTAESNSWSPAGYIGTYPIEIEEPIYLSE